MSSQPAIILGLVIYALIMFCVSYYWMRRVKKPSDYLLAGRGLPYWVLIGTITATGVGTGVVVGASGLAYQHGWAGSAYPIGLGLGSLLTGLFFAKMRRYQFMTLGEEIACYCGKKRIVVEFSYISLFLSQLGWLTVQIMGGGAVFSVVTGLDLNLCIILAGFITALISIPGGLKTVVYADFLQAIILLLGFGILAYGSMSDVGGLGGLKNTVPSEYFSFMGTGSYGSWEVYSLILVLVLSIIADPGRRLAMYSAYSEAGAKWSMVIGGTIVMLFSVIVGITGMYTFHLNPNIANPDQALPWLVMNVLPPWLAAVVVVAVASSVFSSANTNAATAGTFYIRHIYPLFGKGYPKNTMVSVRRALTGAFLLCTVLALYTGNIVQFIVRFLPVTMSGLAVIILLGRFWNRSTWQGAIAALIATPIVALSVMFIPSLSEFWGNPTVPATVVGLLVHITVSKFTPSPRPEDSFEIIAEKMKTERNSIEGESLKGEADDFIPSKSETSVL
ncbi:MAG: sodium:solute symporter family protein [Balneolaceae bacterium]